MTSVATACDRAMVQARARSRYLRGFGGAEHGRLAAQNGFSVALVSQRECAGRPCGDPAGQVWSARLSEVLFVRTPAGPGSRKAEVNYAWR
jgi:hypothetical protein